MPQSINVRPGSLVALKAAPEPVKAESVSTVAFSETMGKAKKTGTLDTRSEVRGDNSADTARQTGERNGKHPPEDDQLLPDEAELNVSLDLNILSSSDEFDADGALLLATRFVVESLPQEVRQIGADVDLISSGTPIKTELLSKLEASMKMLQADASMQNIRDVVNLAAPGSANENLTKIENSEYRAIPVMEMKPLIQPRIDFQVPVRVDSANWGDSVTGRISLMINQRLSSARIHINPPELGPIEVRLNLNSDQASVQFISHSAQVRDALEQSIPRLREMLESAGFSLGDSFVGDQSRDEGSNRQASSEFDQGQQPESGGDLLQHESLGLIDQYV